MHIAMLHDCAYVGYELAKELTKQGILVDMLELPQTNKFAATLKLTKTIRKTNADIIHAHFCKFPAFIAHISRKKYIIHCHGSDIRNPKTHEKSIGRTKQTLIKHAEAVLYATPDLKKYLPETAQYLETPIGSQFKNMHIPRIHAFAYRPLPYQDPPVCPSTALQIINSQKPPFKTMGNLT